MSLPTDVINLTLDRDEAYFLLCLQAYGSASIATDLESIIQKRYRLEESFRILGPERANRMLARQVKLIRAAFPDIKITTKPAPDGTELPL